MLIVVAAALLDGDGRVLVQQRPPGCAHGGLWEFPGGKVEPGEGLTAALARELREEIGISVRPEAFAPLSFATEAGGGRELLLLLYALREWMGVPQALHAPALAWLTPGHLGRLPMPCADVALLGALRSLP